MTKDHAKSRRIKQIWAERRAAEANRSNLRKAQARWRRRKTEIPLYIKTINCT